jgi:hypothetical protein
VSTSHGFWEWLNGYGISAIQYIDTIERLYRDYNAYDYWRLMFLLEGISDGSLRRIMSEDRLNDFSKTIQSKVKDLRVGLNIADDGKPKTRQNWLPLFWEIEDLLGKMRKSRYGKYIIDNYLLSDWQQIKQYSTFAYNRHRGMIKSGYWKPFQKLGNYKYIK